MIFRAILDKAYSDEISTITVNTAIIREPKNVSTVVRALNSHLPIPSLQHLKRVKRTADNHFAVVVDHASPGKRIKLSVDKLNSIQGMLENFDEVSVPASAPKTRAQFEQCMKLWPVNFHPEKHIEELVNSTMFEPEEQSWHEYCMSRVAQKTTALVADPLRKLIIASGVDGRETHPLNHSVMMVLEAVAATQRALDSNTPDKPYLCTNWDVYLSREPCPMCAMALVHSRAKRVFFNARQLQSGALVSRGQIQFLKDLNHHYQVFEAEMK